MENIFQVAIYAILALFLVGLIYMIGIVVVGGYVMPLTLELNPHSEVGVSSEQYTDIASTSWDRMKQGFYIILTSIFVYVGVKLFYQKEETSRYYG